LIKICFKKWDEFVKTETRVGLFILIAIGIFLYLSINIKTLRLDKYQYYTYKAYFDDTGGLTIKSPVKIAGVDVGWVENINLLDNGKAEILIRVSKDNKLAKNAYATIHQDGLIGTKNLEIDPGSSATGYILPGGVLSMPGKTPASVGELLDQFRDIAATIQDITFAIKNVVATRQGEENMRNTLDAVAKASNRLADFSDVLQRTMQKNEETINSMLSDFRETAASFKAGVPQITDDVHGVAGSFQAAGDKATGAFGQIEDTAVQARDTFREAGQVVEKINTGKGVLGKLINEEEIYGDLKKTVKGFKNYVGKTQSMMLNIDMHSETMLRKENSKGYFDLRLRPNSDCFYSVQLVAVEKGSITKDTTYYKRMDENGTELKPTELNMPVWKKVEFAEQVERTVQKKNDLLFGLQFGKRFNRLALRVGLFENTFGVGCDYTVPLETDNVHWITTLEAFDMRGTNRLDDTRPHIKWLNRLFFWNNLYTTFGVDDIWSKADANPFIGGGLRFGDDDLKYFISYLAPAAAGSKSSGR
jgi:phospholipid/cholesterol/gamma-HCH transport system substrate-binding protein